MADRIDRPKNRTIFSHSRGHKTSRKDESSDSSNGTYSLSCDEEVKLLFWLSSLNELKDKYFANITEKVINKLHPV